MRFDLSFLRLSLKARLITNYLVILGVGGLATSIVGSWIVSSTIMRQARHSVDRDLAAARTLYEQELRTLEITVRLAAGTTAPRRLSEGDLHSLLAYLRSVRAETRFDFFNVTDAHGRVILRSAHPGKAGDDVLSISVVRAALRGKAAAATEILPADLLGNEDPALREKARMPLVPTPRAKRVDRIEETSGMALIAAAPVRAADGSILGALYGGILLNRNLELVDRLWETIYGGEPSGGRDAGTVTIFQNELRIATTVPAAEGGRALGTTVSAEVNDVVLGRGESWKDRAFVVRDWYISGYEPIRNYDGKVVGMLYVGLLESAYTAIRNRVILSFFGIATIGFILIIAITYYEISRITRPIGEMVAATREIAAGRLDREVRVDSQGEVALLAASFNSMLESLRQMKTDLEEWGRTLEEKVRQRTEELVTMQARVAQSERLASLGKLAAGVAHEINNPLGGILSLSALTLEDMKEDDPNRENLEEVIRQSARCRDIVKGLLEFSRQSQVNQELVDLNKILLDTVSLVGRQALFLNVSVVKHLDEELPPVMADRSQLQQVFMNILINAVQAMEEKGTITIVTRSSGEHAEVRISDTGCGIPADRIGRIFDPFFTTKADGEGTGLGLSIAYGIIAEHRGSISVASEVGKGSTFTIRIPAAPESRRPAAASAMPAAGIQ